MTPILIGHHSKLQAPWTDALSHRPIAKFNISI